MGSAQSGHVPWGAMGSRFWIRRHSLRTARALGEGQSAKKWLALAARFGRWARQSGQDDAHSRTTGRSGGPARAVAGTNRDAGGVEAVGRGSSVDGPSASDGPPGGGSLVRKLGGHGCLLGGGVISSADSAADTVWVGSSVLR